VSQFNGEGRCYGSLGPEPLVIFNVGFLVSVPLYANALLRRG
jgi:hypothetical protein